MYFMFTGLGNNLKSSFFHNLLEGYGHPNVLPHTQLIHVFCLIADDKYSNRIKLDC
jgi:hypothetical protein